MLAQNTAWHIAAHLEYPVMLADFDLTHGTVGLNLNLDPDAGGMAEALRDIGDLDKMLLDRIADEPVSRLKVLSCPPLLIMSEDVHPEIMRQMVEALQSANDLVILDLPSHWSPWVREVLSLSETVVITAVPDLGSLRNTKLLIERLEEMRPQEDPPLLVLNQVNQPHQPQIAQAKFEKALDRKAVASIPYDGRHFGKAVNEGEVLEKAGAGHAVLGGSDVLARTLSHQKIEDSHGLAALVSRVLKRSR
jgi:pilus assembly protein CpaE